ncbi:hypothetical protein LDENG_00218650 [Lucifuga dentata]|nr:hypothetical protein LDENG_00218650 [Lucifuga dentata]
MLMEDIGLVDIWRLVNPCGKEYTFFSHHHKSYSRIDFFLLSKSVIEQVIDCIIGPIALSDHAPVEIQIDLNTETGKRGRWRMNTMLLKDEGFSDKLAEDLACFFELNIGTTEKLSSVWEASKAYIRGKLIAQTSKRKNSMEQIIEMEAEITTLEKVLSRQYTNALYKDLCNLKYKLNNIYNKKKRQNTHYLD